MTRSTMTRYWLRGVAAIVLAQLSHADTVTTAPRPIVLKAARLFDAVSGKLVEHGMVVVADTKIQAVGSDAKIPDNARVIDLGDATWVGEHLDAFPPAIAVKARTAAAQVQQMFQHAVKIGVPLAMGTDAGVEPHGLNAREFSLMTKNGLAAAQALIAGTANGADLLGLADQTGTLTPGKLADIVAVAGNPLIDMHVTEHPVFVMKEGTVYVSDPDARGASASR